MIKASDFITRVEGGTKAKAGYIVKDSLSSSVLYFFNLSDSSVIPLSDVYIPDTQVLEPEYHGSSGGGTASMDFYKCSAVNSDSTWSGYKAVWSSTEQFWEFCSDSTHIEGYILQPIVGSIYNTDCSIKASMYTGFPDDAIATCFMNGVIDTSWTTDSYTSTTKDGIVCVQFSKNKMYTKQVQTAPQGNAARSFSVWAYVNTSTKGSLLSWGQDSNNHIYQATVLDTGFLYVQGMYIQTDFRGAWHHFAVTHDENNMNIGYVDGVKVLLNQASSVLSTSGDTITMGGHSNYSLWWLSGYIANARIYNRVLSQRLVKALFNLLHVSVSN